jgi:peptidoglycan/xylan/chitin deacetylase (PgdA/CDA1 family)
MSEQQLKQRLDLLAAQGQHVTFWLRDDDAVEPTPALDQLLQLVARYQVPLTLAVIPQHTGTELAARLEREDGVSVAVHGWSHENHAPATDKKQELGAHRPASVVLAELKAGFDKLHALYGTQFLPMLVPPWNRIAPALVPDLNWLGFETLSVFGREKASSPLLLLNTHVDVMDWHGTHGGRDADVLFGEIAAWLDGEVAAIGILTHHLVHDAAVWQFLERLFQLTSEHPACRWMSAKAILAKP